MKHQQFYIVMTDSKGNEFLCTGTSGGGGWYSTSASNKFSEDNLVLVGKKFETVDLAIAGLRDIADKKLYTVIQAKSPSATLQTICVRAIWVDGDE